MAATIVMPDGADGPTSIAETVRRYIDARPVVRDALAMGIVNLSALSRQIVEATGAPSADAVLAACRRYDPPRQTEGYEAAIRRVLSKSKLEVRTHVAIVTARPTWSSFQKVEQAMNRVRGRDVPIHVIQGSESLTIITDEGFHEELVDLIGDEAMIKTRTGLVEINLRSPEVIEDVPGILAFVTSTLSDRGINFVEVISCYKDSMFVLEQDDLSETFDVLNRLIRA